jgi:hypothetical protein
MSASHPTAASFRPHVAISELPAGTAGIRVRAEVYRCPTGARSIRVVGSCRASVSDGSASSILRGLVLVVTRAPRLNPISFAVAGDAVVFDDDIVHEGGFASAAFELDLFAGAGVSPEPGTYFIHACLHGMVSNVERAELTG